MTILDDKLTLLASQLLIARAAISGATTIPPATPETLFAAVQAVVDGHRAQLAASGGAALVSRIAPGAGAVKRAIDDLILNGEISVVIFG